MCVRALLGKRVRKIRRGEKKDGGGRQERDRGIRRILVAISGAENKLVTV